MIKQSVNQNDRVSLAELLAARERRAALQQRLITKYRSTLISLTVNIPGVQKMTPCSRYIFEQARQHLTGYYQQQASTLIKVIIRYLPTGPEGVFILNDTPVKLKNACLTLEQSHPLGRLWDIDVISAMTGNSLSRQAIGHPPRQCLLCAQEAKVCARSQTHTTAELLDYIEQLASESGFSNSAPLE